MLSTSTPSYQSNHQALHDEEVQNLTKLKSQKSPVIMVASGKGGVGKTWLSITLCQALVEMHQKILLFDGDLGLANVDIQLGLMPAQDLGTVISGQASLQEIVISYDQAKFDIIAGRSGSDILSSISPERLLLIQHSLEKLINNYDGVIMDMGAGIGQTIRTLSQVASVCLVVVTDEPTSLTDAYAFIKMIHTLRPELLIEIVINQAEDLSFGERTFMTLTQVCQRFLNFTPSLAGIIIRDLLIRDTICHQVPLLTRHSQSVSAQAVRTLAHSILKRHMTYSKRLNLTLMS